jgi:hypothetical protein
MSQTGYTEPIKVTVLVDPERSFSSVSTRPGPSAPTCREGYAEYS